MRHAVVVAWLVVCLASSSYAANILIVRPAEYKYGALTEKAIGASLKEHNIEAVDFTGVPRRKIERVVNKYRQLIIIAIGPQSLAQVDFLGRPIFYAGVKDPAEYKGREITGVKVATGKDQVLEKACLMGFPAIGTVYVDGEDFVDVALDIGDIGDIGETKEGERDKRPDLVEEVWNCEATDPQILGVRAFGEKAVYPAVTRVIKALSDMGGAFWIPPTSELYNPELVDWVLRKCRRYRVPVIGFGPGLLRYGALAALTPDPIVQGQQVAKLVKRYLELGKIPHYRYAHIRMMLNPRVAKAFGLEKFIANQ